MKTQHNHSWPIQHDKAQQMIHNNSIKRCAAIQLSAFWVVQKHILVSLFWVVDGFQINSMLSDHWKSFGMQVKSRKCRHRQLMIKALSKASRLCWWCWNRENGCSQSYSIHSKVEFPISLSWWCPIMTTYSLDGLFREDRDWWIYSS